MRGLGDGEGGGVKVFVHDCLMPSRGGTGRGLSKTDGSIEAVRALQGRSAGLGLRSSASCCGRLLPPAWQRRCKLLQPASQASACALQRVSHWQVTGTSASHQSSTVTCHISPVAPETVFFICVAACRRVACECASTAGYHYNHTPLHTVICSRPVTPHREVNSDAYLNVLTNLPSNSMHHSCAMHRAELSNNFKRNDRVMASLVDDS